MGNQEVKKWFRYSRCRLWWRGLKAYWHWKKEIWRNRFWKVLGRFSVEHSIPFLVWLGMEDPFEANYKIRRIEEIVEYCEEGERKLIEAGWSGSIDMTNDEFDAWYPK